MRVGSIVREQLTAPKPEVTDDGETMAERTEREIGHSTIWRCDEDVCRMVADIYDREAALNYRDLLIVLSAGHLPEVRFEVVENAGFWSGGSR